MNILIDTLPDRVQVKGKTYPIRTDFRVSILFELMMQDDRLDADQKIQQALGLYYPELPGHAGEAVSALLWFYRCGKEDTVQKKRMAARRGQTRVYDFEYDADYIYAAFLTQYGIDLQDAELHWWKFRAMFHSLTKEHEFVKIMGYRSMELEKLPKEQRDFYRRMKRLHQLPQSDSETERQEAIEAALVNGTDLTGLL